MKIQILRMRNIYSAAKFTTAAVSAESADVGLLGTTVSDPPSSGISTCETVEDLEVLLESAPWSSRAWCYQEKVISHRILIFTSAGVYMHCQRTILTSTGTPLNRRDGTSSISSTPYTRFDTVGAMLSVAPGEDLESYISAVEFYSKRHLTNLSDKRMHSRASSGTIKASSTTHHPPSASASPCPPSTRPSAGARASTASSPAIRYSRAGHG
jgi:hypothetical protein